MQEPKVHTEGGKMKPHFLSRMEVGAIRKIGRRKTSVAQPLSIAKTRSYTQTLSIQEDHTQIQLTLTQCT